jgi:hypothetical protein
LWPRIDAPSQKGDVTMDPLGLDGPGAQCRIIETDGDWALGQAQGDEPIWVEWMKPDDRVHLYS